MALLIEAMMSPVKNHREFRLKSRKDFTLTNNCFPRHNCDNESSSNLTSINCCVSCSVIRIRTDEVVQLIRTTLFNYFYSIGILFISACLLPWNFESPLVLVLQ
jgi:hypothetical protein